MLRTAELLPLTGLSTLGFDPARFPAEPPACYRASWQLLGRDSHPLATTSLCWINSHQAPPTLGARTIEVKTIFPPAIQAAGPTSTSRSTHRSPRRSPTARSSRPRR